MVTSTIVGQVIDEDHKPLQGCKVTLSGHIVATDEFGLFSFPVAHVPSNRSVIEVERDGYFKAYHAEETRTNGITRLVVMMTPKITTTLSSKSGGTVYLPHGAAVQFQPESFISSSGAAYAGSVTVTYNYLDPASNDFFEKFPGDFTAVRADNSKTNLFSYGVQLVEISSSTGERLSVLSDKPATLTFPIASSAFSSSPQSIPLWYFDEQLQAWKEEGSATKTKDGYVGTVKHFTPWNCDQPVSQGRVRGRLVCRNDGIAGVIIRVGQVKVLTDTGGRFNAWIQADQPVSVKVEAIDNNGRYYLDDPISVRVQANEIRDIGNVELPSGCPSYLFGEIHNCKDSTVGGIVIARYSGGLVWDATQDGHFRLNVPENTTFEISAAAFDGTFSEPVSTASSMPGSEVDAGALKKCEGDNSRGYAYTIIEDPITKAPLSVTDAKFSNDGNYVAVAISNSTSPEVRIYNVASNKLMLTVNTPKLKQLPYGISSIGWTANDQRMLIRGYSGALLIDVWENKELQFWGDSLRNALSFPDGDRLLAYRLNSKPTEAFGVYSASTGKLEEILSINADSIGAPLRFRNGGAEVILSCSNTRVDIYDLNTKARLRTLNIGSVGEVSRDGNIISGYNYSTNSWSFSDVNTLQTLGVAPQSYPISISNAKKAATVATVQGDQMVGVLFDLGASFAALPLTGQLAGVTYTSFDFSEDGSKLVGSYLGGIVIWNIK